MARRGVPVLVGLAAFLALVGSAQASSPAERQIQGLFWAVTWFALLVSVIVYGALFYFLWRYRESASPPRRVASEGNSEGDKKVEAIWTVFPIVILVIITFLSVPVLLFTDSMPPADATIHVTAERFVWRFRYEEPGVDEQNWTETIGEAWFQRGIVVHFKVTSNDTIHSFALPQLGIKIDAIPHQVNTVWTRVDVAGDYLNQCAEYCGVGHYGMRATLHVFEPEAGRKPYGPPPTTVPFTSVELREFGGSPWSIDPPVIDATSSEPIRLRIQNSNSVNYTFRIGSPVDLEVFVPAFGHAWLNTTVVVPSDREIPYGPTDATARANGMKGALNVTVAVLIELNEWTVRPSPLELPKGPVKFLLRNNGNQVHNFTMGGVYANVAYAGLIAGGQSVVIGPFDLDRDASGHYWCAVPGHRQAGMEAPYIVGLGGAVESEVPLFDMAAITFAVGIPSTLAYTVRHARRRDE